MAWKKKESGSDDTELRRIVKSSKVPLLTLDSRWHELFPDFRKTPRIRELERQINDLLKKQGKAQDDRKEMKKLKQRLMEEIVFNISEDGGEVGKLKRRKQEKSQKLILEINEKMEKCEEDLDAIPKELERANEELMLESLKVWQGELEENNQKIEELNAWILETREKLKEGILRKQDMEARNNEMYGYMHDILGAKLMEQIDIRRGGQ